MITKPVWEGGGGQPVKQHGPTHLYKHRLKTIEHEHSLKPYQGHMGNMDLARVFSRVPLPRQSVSDGSQAQTRGRQSHAEAGRAQLSADVDQAG